MKMPTLLVPELNRCRCCRCLSSAASYIEALLAKADARCRDVVVAGVGEPEQQSAGVGKAFWLKSPAFPKPTL